MLRLRTFIEPVITDDLEGFLLSAVRPVMNSPSNDSDVHRHRNTKLPLLRYVRKLLNQPKRSDMEPGIFPEDDHVEAERSLDQVMTILTRATEKREIMPRMKCIGTGLK